MKKKSLGAGLMLGLLASALALAGGDAYVNSIKLEPSDREAAVIAKAARVVPTENQLRWQEMELVAFAHFGMNTFTNKEWGDGTEDPALFNPTAFDARQWARVLKEAGFQELIITAKHHDGFCLWPSQYTEHSVKSSPWKNGQGDVVREVADACREYGLKLGIYLSPWDRHDPRYGTPAYNDHYKNQLRELLTNYGEVTEVWFDGAGMGEKWKTMQGLYDWQGYFNLVHELQPQAVVFNERGDARWVGNEAGKGRPSEWSVVPADYSATDTDIGSRQKLISAAKTGQVIKWLPAETDTSIRPGWFYHKREDLLVKSLPHLVNIYFDSVGNNSLLLLNMPPDRRGLINEHDVARLRQFKKYLDETFRENLAAEAKSSPASGGTVIEYDLGSVKTFNVAMLQEDLRQGQRVEEFALEIRDGQAWKTIATGTTIGYKRLLRFPAQSAAAVRVRILRSRLEPHLDGFGLFKTP